MKTGTKFAVGLAVVVVVVVVVLYKKGVKVSDSLNPTTDKKKK